MTTTKKRRVKIVESPQKCNFNPDGTGLKKVISKSGQRQKSAGKNVLLFDEENAAVLPSTAAARLLGQQLATQSSFLQARDKVSTTKDTNQIHPSTKIKLQLFPIDEATREGLEKDGYNPFLELTLRARKKISSVLEHINAKWGASSIAEGDPILVPYNIQLDKCSDKRWTLKDTCIKAGDVFAAIDRPTVFRLRYGWISNLESQNLFNFSSSKAISRSEGIPKACDLKSELTTDPRKESGETREHIEPPSSMRKTAEAAVTEQMFVDVPVNYSVDEVKMDNNLGQSVVPWDDCLTNLSIGGLFSEASLLGKIDTCKSNQNQQEVQQFLQISDTSMGRFFCEASFQGKIKHFESVINVSTSSPHSIVDKSVAETSIPWDDNLTTLSIGGLLSEASLKGKISEPQLAKPPLHNFHSSILDAEETCHAFAFCKFSSCKDDVALSQDARSGCCSHEDDSSSSKLKKQIGLAQDCPYQESMTDQLPGSKVHNEDNNLGLTGIKWNDSLGPFDLCISRQFMGGESMSISKIFQ